ncbi:MAG: hypothetical protein MJZ36_01425 [Bacteroidaceae bacterium]|nr:hypothetical protein [Bacteroidaceae bacterium]
MNANKSEEYLKEFDIYLSKIKCIGAGARSNYISWARFLMQTHNLLDIRTEEDVQRILKEERRLMAMPGRMVYKTERDYGNFRATLNRFLPFMQCYICKQDHLRNIISLDDMINLVGEQPSRQKAYAMDEAVRIIVFERDCSLTEDQKKRLKANVSKVESRISVDKFFAPGSHYHSN